MAQKQYSTYQVDILSFELRDALIGILKPGRYLGYNGMSEYQAQVGNDVYCAIEQEDPISKYDQQNPPVVEAARGVAITSQGTIIAEDSSVQVTVTITPTNSNGIYHIVYMEHAYLSGTPGANPATYGLKSGVDGGGIPGLQYHTKQVVIGVIFEEDGSTGFSSLIYHPFHPGIGDDDLYNKLFKTSIYKTYAEGTVPTSGIIGSRQFLNNNYVTDYESITKAISDLDAAVKARADAITALAATKLDDWATPDDNTDLNASISRHGLLPKLPNDADKYLNGIGSWVVPKGGHIVWRSGVWSSDKTILPSDSDSGTINLASIIGDTTADMVFIKVSLTTGSGLTGMLTKNTGANFYKGDQNGVSGGCLYEFTVDTPSNNLTIIWHFAIGLNAAQEIDWYLVNKALFTQVQVVVVGWQSYAG